MAANRQIECERSNRMDTTAGLDAPPLKDSTSQYGYLVYFKTRPTSIVFLGSIIYDLSLASYTSPSGRYNNYCEPRHSSNISEASNRYAVLSYIHVNTISSGLQTSTFNILEA
ncbi:hypothetical protein EYR41_005807 [Orbilia oligospora]|uniref:Uncharacterized protein n=1 Tax=Orbilia oligospora TaxID=2813651 RepID=A0A8H2E0X7_ORBOL|nr:hypothetical protein TWF128_010940 [Orbilia oligospora]KAF3272117.1 hypothetical protein TWF217_003929 [Orbilia oligospora]KAF3297716.1 hypothetical protein TWF132_006114 [Orbilia oligospora]TGJ69791.1 hypothetical protein EYR41_005807 [Orbilia oligospora]